MAFNIGVNVVEVDGKASPAIAAPPLSVAAFLVLNALDLAILVTLTAFRGWPVIAFAVLGLVGSIGYAAPVLRFKKRGLGEPVVFLVWGPLMVGGTYFAATGHLPWQLLAASIPYSILCTTVLFGKHIDKVQWDEPLKIGTLPVCSGRGWRGG